MIPVSFIRRLFSSDYRRALAAEAAGDYLEAARAYALANHRAKVAEMHILRAERAATRGEEMDALRDALRWCDDDSAERRRASRALARALEKKVTAEGLATERDRETLREAAALYEQAGDFRDAGAIWERLGADEDAARAYEKGGVVDKMELALARDEQRERNLRRLKAAFEEYELHLRGGDRESALSAIRLCCDLADTKGEYRRLLDELVRRRIADGRVTLRARAGGKVAVVCGGKTVSLGRHATCGVALRSAGVSRMHAEISFAAGAFTLRDLGSKSGTFIGGMPVEGSVPLRGAGAFALGEDTELAYAEEAGALRLEVARGLDRGTLVLHAPAGAVSLAVIGLDARLRFEDGRPLAEAAALRLNGVRAPRGVAQLLREDVIAVGDDEAEVS